MGRPDSWNEDAVILATALSVYERTRIDHLGFPKRLTQEGDNEGHFEVVEGFNAAQQAHDLYVKDQAEKKREPGVYTYIVDTRQEG